MGSIIIDFYDNLSLFSINTSVHPKAQPLRLWAAKVQILVETKKKHTKRVMEWVVRRSQTSILLIGDKQSEFAFHQLGYRTRKNAEELLQTPSEIEFF
ncbi:MAG: hypothetical protein IKQ20_09990 [Bacteroidales bacterium]|nr:hypothetical protein [Bacteroidales bacterium]